MLKLSVVKGAAVAVAIAFGGAAATMPAVAQIPPGMTIPGMPGMMTQAELTEELVVNFIAGYPTIQPALEAAGERYNVPEGNDAAAAMAAMAMLGAATNELNGIVTPFGFTDFNHYVSVMTSILSALAFAGPDLTAQEKAMMLQFMPPFMVPSDANVAVVAAHYTELETLLDE
ncbi:MAG: hypothetical protein KIT43_01875 [Bauldia sp.]|nr:hypothetical protein [Bauldia sp.]